MRLKNVLILSARVIYLFLGGGAWKVKVYRRTMRYFGVTVPFTLRSLGDEFSSLRDGCDALPISASHYADVQGRGDLPFLVRRARDGRAQAHGHEVVLRHGSRPRPVHVLQALPVVTAQDPQDQLPRLLTPEHLREE